MKELRKTVNLNNKIYNLLKDYCDKHGLKIRWVLEKIIEEYIYEHKNDN